MTFIRRTFISKLSDKSWSQWDSPKDFQPSDLALGLELYEFHFFRCSPSRLIRKSMWARLWMHSNCIRKESEVMLKKQVQGCVGKDEKAVKMTCRPRSSPPKWLLWRNRLRITWPYRRWWTRVEFINGRNVAVGVSGHRQSAICYSHNGAEDSEWAFCHHINPEEFWRYLHKHVLLFTFIWCVVGADGPGEKGSSAKAVPSRLGKSEGPFARSLLSFPFEHFQRVSSRIVVRARPPRNRNEAVYVPPSSTCRSAVFLSPFSVISHETLFYDLIKVSVYGN